MKYWIFVLALAPEIARGGASDYQCTVKQELAPSYVVQGLGPGIGELRPVPKSPFVGERFAVDRATGRVIGSLFDTSGADEIKVIHRGSDNMAFKVIAIGQGKIKVLVIRENTVHPEKEFYGMFHPVVLAGMCK
ncbi:MAG TPA: hypothetical protein VNN13_08005 [Methylomirabilota bacterium]|nr:hypothetical protein [Methylomirabilota bacterium]